MIPFVRRCSWLWLLPVLAPFAAPGQTNPPRDLSKEPVLYEVGYTHLDTQYRWAYPQVIREFLPNTVRSNVMLFEKYPDYVFNWTGANRYRLMQEYHPADFAAVREWAARGRWFPAGSSWEESDVIVPSPESLIRQIFFGHDFFKENFNTESDEYMLPDSFGFPASLPSVLAHCGLRGFSTQKLSWGSAVGTPFNIGVWKGPDGNSVIAALNPGAYESKITNNPATDTNWLARLNANGKKNGVFADYAYFGNSGDRGGAPYEASVSNLENAVHSKGPVRVVSARADQMFRDITDGEKARLTEYRGDFLLTEHSAGSINSAAAMKHWNRENELLANAAETAATTAHLLDSTPYPREKLHHAWELVLAAQFHDLLPGTALPQAFNFSWNDEVIALNSFSQVLQDSVSAVAHHLDTRVKGTPIVIYNPLSIAREDVVEAELEIQGVTNLQIFDSHDKPVPTQMLSNADGKCHFLFLATAPSVGLVVYSTRESAAPIVKPPQLKVTGRLLENERYRITMNDAGDVAGIYDKAAKHELLSAPARMEFIVQNPVRYPAWNMTWEAQTNAPRGYVDGPAQFRIVENGPVRVSIEVRREAEGSVFVQTIRLAAGDAGNRVEIANRIDWQTHECALKVALALTVSNPLATYNWELGKVRRGNDDPKKFEVPTHGWFDVTDTSGKYGVSILTGAKYGSDKPSDNLVRLTLLYTPGVKNAPGRSQEQQWQDWGRHDFVYGIYGHAGDWRKGRPDWQAARLDQPLIAFATASHEGRLGRSFSLLHASSDEVAVRCIKLAEHEDRVIVRLQELDGTGTKSVRLNSVIGIGDGLEVNGLEQPLRPLKISSGSLKLDFTPWQLRSLELTMPSVEKLTPPVFAFLKLPYNLDGFSFRDEKPGGDFDGAGSTIPAEMIGDTINSGGVPFQIGPRAAGELDMVSCQGQTISLPAGKFNRLCFLAASSDGDTGGTFTVDGHAANVRVQNWTGYIGQWDNRVFEGAVKELTYSVSNRLERIDPGFIKRDPLAWFCSHRRLADGSDAIYSYSYLFKYELDLPAGAKELVLPDNPRIKIAAATVIENDHEDVQPLQPLYDDFDNRKVSIKVP